MWITTIRFGVVQRTEIQPEDLRDAVSTLSFNNKIAVSIPPPGLGPTVLLDWAQAELAEATAAAATVAGLAERKAFAATIIAKTAVECLLDWYLDSSYLGFTLRLHAGTEEKLEALDAEGLLSIGTSLFRDVLFEPRNRAVHDYQAVDLKSAKSYQVTSSLLEWERGKAKPIHVAKVENMFKTMKGKYEEARSKYTFMDKTNKRRPFINWCNKSVAKQATECGTEFERLYDLVYKQMSAYIHGSAWSLRRQIAYSRAHYDSDIVLNDIATIVRTALGIWVEWAKFCVFTLGWRLEETLLGLANRIDELDERHFS